MSDVTAQIIFELRSRQRHAISLGDEAEDLWGRMAELVELHRPSDPERPGSDPLCSECSGGMRIRPWPCQTFRVLSDSLRMRRVG
jgi:hypothetical protein